LRLFDKHCWKLWTWW